MKPRHSRLKLKAPAPHPGRLSSPDSRFETRRGVLKTGLALGLPAFGADASETASALPLPEPGQRLDTVIRDPKTSRRIALRVRRPTLSDPAQPAPLILHSPGLGSGLANGAPWCDAWQNAGFWVITLSHPVTNEDLWDASRGPFKARMSAALAAGQYPARAQDVRFVLDRVLNGGALAPLIDAGRIGLSGHSYGALTAQALAGQQGSAQLEPRLRAFVALSPSAMSRASAQRMAAVKAPFLCVIGAQDGYVSFMEGAERIQLGVPVVQRHWVHEALPQAHRALSVIEQADHMTLAGEEIDARRFSRDVPARPPEEARAWQEIARVSTDFWRKVL
jgi:predicted dienelactone hydrolase